MRIHAGSPSRYAMLAVAAVCSWMRCAESAGNGGTSSDQPQTVEDVVNLIEGQRARIHSLKVSYHSDLDLDPQLRKEGRLGGVRTHTEVTFAFSGDKRHVTSKSEGILDNGRTSKSPIGTTVFDGRECRSRFPSSKKFTIHRARSAYCEMNAYTSGLKWPITEAEREHAEGDPEHVHFLPQMLRAAGWTVGTNHEPQLGFSCICLRNPSLGRELWLGREVGYNPVKLVHQNPVEGVESWTTTYSEFQRYENNIWLPRRIRATDVWQATSRFSAGSHRNDVVVDSLEVNNVNGDLFILQPQPGELVINELTGEMHRFIPESDTTLEDTIATTVVTQPESRLRSVLLASNIGIVLGAVATWLVWTYRKRQR